MVIVLNFVLGSSTRSNYYVTKGYLSYYYIQPHPKFYLTQPYRFLVIPGSTGYQYEQIHIVMSRVVITLILLIMGSYFFCKTKL